MRKQSWSLSVFDNVKSQPSGTCEARHNIISPVKSRYRRCGVPDCQFIQKLVCFFLAILCTSSTYAAVIGPYEIADFSSQERPLTVGTGVQQSSISQSGNLQLVNLSGDNAYIKTDTGIGSFTYDSDWSWMTIVKKDPGIACRIFMRGFAWVDKDGDFDLRLDSEQIKTWQRRYGWHNLNTSDTAVNNNELVWLANTYDVSEQKSRIYVNGNLVQEFAMMPMDDRNNTNPVNINGQWANNNHGVGNIYGEGTFDLAQLILAKRRFSADELRQAYENRTYMPSDELTTLDVRIVPEPASMLLLTTGLLFFSRKKTGKCSRYTL